jgi:hypothetical protein
LIGANIHRGHEPRSRQSAPARDRETVAGEPIALLDTERDVALIRAGGIIPLILRRALMGG